MRRAWWVACGLLLAGCVAHPVGPARTFGAYEAKARTSAESALSAVATTRLAAGAGADDRAWGTYLAVVVSEQEDDITGVAGTFGSIQPPDDRADAMRAELDDILGEAIDHIADVRIAVRRGELADLDAVAAPLAGDEQALRDFLAAHQ